MATHNNKELTLTHIFDAPRALVFKAWTDPSHLAKWWGPNGFTNPVCEANAVPGGAIRIHMYHPDFPDHWVKGVFRELDEPNRIVFENNGHVGEHNEPFIESVTTVTLDELDGKTKLTLHVLVNTYKPEMESALAGMEEGWSQSLARLGGVLLQS